MIAVASWQLLFMTLVAAVGVGEWLSTEELGRLHVAAATLGYAGLVATGLVLSRFIGFGEEFLDSSASPHPARRRTVALVSVFLLLAIGRGMFSVDSGADALEKATSIVVLASIMASVFVPARLGLSVFLGLQLMLTYLALMARHTFGPIFLAAFGFAWIGVLMTVRMSSAQKRGAGKIRVRPMRFLARVVFMEAVCGVFFLPLTLFSWGAEPGANLFPSDAVPHTHGAENFGGLYFLVPTLVCLLLFAGIWSWNRYLRRRKKMEEKEAERVEMLGAVTEVATGQAPAPTRVFARPGHAGEVLRLFNRFASAMSKMNQGRREAETVEEFLTRLNRSANAIAIYNNARYSPSEISYEDLVAFEQVMSL